jgi:hypothetical protein
MPTVSINDVPFKHGLSAPDLDSARKYISECQTKARHLRDELLKVVQAGDEAGQASATAALLTDPASRVAAAISANKKLKAGKRQTLERCLAVPSLLDFQAPLSEPVPVYPQPKKSGDPRMIHNPGLLHRTAQTIVQWIVGAYFVPRSFQYTHLGVPAAIKKVNALVKAGHVHAARLDIKDFFVSFDAEKLATELPLPKEVVDHAVVGRLMKVVMDQEKPHGSKIHGSPSTTELSPSLGCLLWKARLGIPQGSGCSPIVGMLVISRLAWTPMPGVMLINYADDFLLLAVTPQLLDEAIEQLTEAVQDLPGGHFTLKLSQNGPLKRGIGFLGHKLEFQDGQLKTSPSDSNVQELFNRADPLDERLGKALYTAGKPANETAAIESLAKLLALITGWEGAFRECDDPKRYVAPLRCTLEEGMGKLGLTEEQLKTHIEPSMIYHPGNYAFEH